jgi:SRSO17 transposase
LVGVARQYCAALGKVANCQVGASVHAVTEQASCPLDWRLFLPESWDSDTERRRKAHVPADQRHRPKWQLALELLDELAAWDLAAPMILADAAYGEVTEFRLGLEQRRLAYVVQVPGTISAYPQDVAPQTVPYTGRGRPPVARYRQRRSSLRQLMLSAGEQAATAVAWREGADGAPLASRFVALRVRPAGVWLRRARPAGIPSPITCTTPNQTRTRTTPTRASNTIRLRSWELTPRRNERGGVGVPCGRRCGRGQAHAASYVGQAAPGIGARE